VDLRWVALPLMVRAAMYTYLSVPRDYCGSAGRQQHYDLSPDRQCSKQILLFCFFLTRVLLLTRRSAFDKAVDLMLDEDRGRTLLMIHTNTLPDLNPILIVLRHCPRDESRLECKLRSKLYKHFQFSQGTMIGPSRYNIDSTHRTVAS
jgi:hypothetical protein